MSMSSECRCITSACLLLKLWIDQIARVGRTFSYADEKPQGLLVGKKATFIIATGGYDGQTQMASLNFVEPYLRSVFAFIGVTNATFLTAGGTAALSQGHDRNAFLAPHLQAVRSVAKPQETHHRKECINGEILAGVVQFILHGYWRRHDGSVEVATPEQGTECD